MFNKLFNCLFIICISLFTSTNLFAQSCANYTVTSSSGISYSSISTSSPSYFTWRNTTSNQNDDNRSFSVPIGFDFWYLGVKYSTISATLNGAVDFSSSTSDGNTPSGSSPYGSNWSDQFSSGGANGTMLALAPLYADLITSSHGTTPIASSLVYLLSGSAPNRVFTVEWIDFDHFNSPVNSPSASYSFQVKIHEITGVIDFNYGTMTGVSGGSYPLQFSCGINNTWALGTPTAAELLTQQTVNTTTFNNTPSDHLTTIPTSNTQLTFTPPIPSGAPTGLSFSAVGKTSITLNWTDNASNEVAYAIYFSTDNINFTYASQVSANSTTATITGLTSATNYYWQVFAVTEGQLSSALVGTHTTLAGSNIISNATGLWSSTSTWAGGIVPVAGDSVIIANTHTITLDVNASCGSLNIGQGSSGKLIIGTNATGLSLTVTNNIKINSGATITTGAITSTHTLSLSGNIINNGIINFATNGSSVCDVIFNKNGNQTISGTGATNTFNNITLNLGASSANVLTVSVSNFIAASNFLTLTNGTFYLASSATITPFTSSANIPLNCGLWVNNSSAIINTAGGTITLYGYIRSTAGTINIGNATDNNLTSYGGIVNVDGGNINIAGRYDWAGPTVLSNFAISSGTFKVATVGSTTASLAPFDMEEIGSSFNMSGGTIIIERSGVGNLGFVNLGGTLGSVTGGNIQIGDASTPSNQIIQINSSISLPSLIIGNGIALTSQLASNISINNDLTITSGSSLLLGTFSANRTTFGGTLTVAGTLDVGATTGGASGSNFPNNFNSYSMSNGTVIYSSLTGGQTIFATPTYHHLTISNTSGTQSAGGNISMNGVFTTTAGGTFDMTSNYIITGILSVTNAGIFLTGVTSGISTTPIPSGLIWAGTFEYTSLTGSQTIVGGTFTNLIFLNTSGTNTARGNLSVSGILTTTLGGLFDLATYTLSGTITTLTNNGTILTQSTSSTPLPSGKIWGGSVNYNASAGNQTVMSATYATLILSNSSGTQSTNGNIVVNTAFTTTAGGTLNMGINSLIGTITTLTNNGTIRTQNVSATPLPTGKIWGGTVSYDLSPGGQTIITGTYNNLTMGNSNGTQTVNGNLIVNASLTTTAGGTLNMGTSTLTGTLTSLINNGTIRTQNATANPLPTGKTWQGLVMYDNAGSQTVAPGIYNNLTLTNSGIKTTTGINVNGILSMEGTATLSAVPNYGALATLQYNTPIARTAGAEWLTPFTASGGIIITNIGTISLGINKTVNSSIVVNSLASFNLATYSIGGLGSFTLNPVGEIQIGSLAGINNTGAIGNIQVTGIRTFNPLGNYTYNGTATQVFGNGLPLTVNNLTINNGNTAMTLNGNQIINGVLSLINGRIAIGSYTLNINGNFIGSSINCLVGDGIASVLSIGNITSNCTLYFDQSTPGTTNRINNFTYNTASYTTTLGNTLEVKGVVTPTSGLLNTGGFLTLVSNSSGNAVIAAGTGSYIIGNVKAQQYIPNHGRRYRSLSSCMSNAKLEDWRGEIFITGHNTSFPSTADVSSTIGGALNWGFDATSTNNPSVFTFNETTNNWTPVTNPTNSLTSTPLTVGSGYRVLVRGDRSSTSVLSGNATTPQDAVVTIDLNGSVNTGNIIMPVTYTSSTGWCFLGNPYPCTYNWGGFWNTVLPRNVSPSIWIWNAGSNSYLSYNAASHSGTLTNGYIPSNAGFFVQTSGVSPSMTFTETYKTTSVPLSTFKTSSDELLIKFIVDSSDIDQFSMKYMIDATDDFDKFDIYKMINPSLNIFAYGADSVHLATSVRKLDTRSSDTILLGITSTFNGLHRFEFSNVENFSMGKKVTLIDRFTSTNTDVTQKLVYNFEINSDPASSHTNRFSIIISDISTSISETLEQSQLSTITIFPNPAHKSLQLLTGNNIISEFTIYDMIGKEVMYSNYLRTVNNISSVIDINTLKAGLYFISLKTSTDTVHKIKFVKD